ncbi:transglycosylase SLT domain-containing protein [Streptomyces sp. NPDC047967]|uniref:transglycosylase SLT domain-containing protein n=1 Tax=Streptomyces sp. NPDC047967 TaxID=3154924 RepID=UPI0033C75A29
MASEGRGSIRVGTGHVEVVPKISQDSKTELRTGLVRAMEQAGTAAGRAYKSAASKALKGASEAVEKEAKKASAATKKEAKKTSAALKQAERYVTKEAGKEAGKRLRTYVTAEKDKQKAAEGLSVVLKRLSQQAIKDTRAEARAKLKAVEDAKKATEKAEKAKATAAVAATREAEKAERHRTAEHGKESRLRMAQERHEAAQALTAIREKQIRQKEADRVRLLAVKEQNDAAHAAHLRRLEEIREQSSRQKLAHSAATADIKQQILLSQAAARQMNDAVSGIRRDARLHAQGIRNEIAEQQAQLRDVRTQMRDVRRQISGTSTTTTQVVRGIGRELRGVGTWFDNIGQSISEAGNILTTKFLAPLALAGSTLATIGVKSADARLLGQLGLSASGVSKGQSADQMTRIQQYAIDTPFSIDVMHEYQMKLIRSVAGSDKRWYSEDPKVKGAAADRAATQATDLIMAIGDSMARAGNLNPNQFTRAMYAMDMIMDMDRAPTKNVRQLIASTGIPAAELAHLLGFPDSEKMYKVMGTPAAKGGGITGKSIMDSMLNYWDPTKYKGDQKTGGSVGYAQAMTNETITGRIQQMKERATYELGNLFIEEDKDGSLKYSGLGEKLMGRDIVEYDERGNVSRRAHEDGLVDKVQNMARDYAPLVPVFLDKFFEAVDNFADMINSVVAFFREHDEFVQLGESIADFLVEWGPLVLAVGLLSKVLGKTIGIVGRLLSPAATLIQGTARGIRGTGRLRSQVNTSARAYREARASGQGHRDARRTANTAYREERARQRGDNDRRGVGQRVADRLTGDRTDLTRGRRELADMERQARAVEERVEELRAELRGVNDQTLRRVQAALAGGSGSVQRSASQARGAAGDLQTAIADINRASLAAIRRETDQVEAAVKSVTRELGQARTKATSLDAAKLDRVTGEVRKLSAAAEGAGKNVTSVSTRVGNLSKRDLKSVTGSMDGFRAMSERTAGQIGDGANSSSVSGRTANLNKRRLSNVIAEFRKLYERADDAYKKVGQGTGAGSLAGRIGLLNGRSLKSVTKQVDGLAKSLRKAAEAGDDLDGGLGRIAKRAPGGGGSSGKKAKGRARGGVVPGYAPWVDSVPTILSPGEGVLRPEVTAAIGEPTINAWNELAIRGRISRHARGGVVGSSGGGRFSLDELQRYVDLNYGLVQHGRSAVDTMRLDSTSDPLGGPVQGGILGTGDRSSATIGHGVASNFRGAYDWMTRGVFSLMKKVPTIVGQAAGVLGGAITPTLGEYFWSDVWKGNGNIVERGQKFLSDTFSAKTLASVTTDLLGGLWDSGKAVASVLADPFGAATEGISGIYETVATSYNSIIDMVGVVRDIRNSPLDYASRVAGGIIDNARESMPNLEGLFDFEKGAKVNTEQSIDLSKLFDVAPSKQGGAVTRWIPVIRQALAALNLSDSHIPLILHRIGVESGGNPRAINNWDINAKNGTPSKGLMQTIDPTFNAYAGPYKSLGVYNPLANIYAGINYAIHRYGKLGWTRALSGTLGYAKGTMSASPGLAVVGEQGRELIDFGGGGQRVYNNAETESLLGRKYEIHIHEARNEPTPQAVMRALQQAEALYASI